MKSMKKLLYFAFVCLGVLLSLNACKKSEDSTVYLALSADNAFTDNAASLTVSLSKASSNPVMVYFAAHEKAVDGKTSVPASKLTFPSSIAITPGSISASIDITLANGAQGEQAVIEITGVSGATLLGSSMACIATPSYGGGGGQGGGQGGEGGEGEDDTPLDLKQNSAWSAQYLGRYTEETTTEPLYRHRRGTRTTGKTQRPVTKAGELTLSLQTNWTLKITGTELVYDAEYNPLFAVEVTAPGSTYIWVDSYTDAELDYYYEGSIAAMLEDYSGIDEGYTVGECFYTTSETVYVGYYEPGATKFYIMDFDAQGEPTGKYGVVELTVPDFENSESGDGDDDEEDNGVRDRIAVSGTGDSWFSFDVFDPGEITADKLEQYIKDISSDILEEYDYWVSLYEMMEEELDFDMTDFLLNSTDNYYNYYELKLGEYDVLIIGMGLDGKPTGEYNISRITVDGHAIDSSLLENTGEDMLTARRKALRRFHRK